MSDQLLRSLWYSQCFIVEIRSKYLKILWFSDVFKFEIISVLWLSCASVDQIDVVILLWLRILSWAVGLCLEIIVTEQFSFHSFLISSQFQRPGLHLASLSSDWVVLSSVQLWIAHVAPAQLSVQVGFWIFKIFRFRSFRSVSERRSKTWCFYHFIMVGYRGWWCSCVFAKEFWLSAIHSKKSGKLWS